MSNLAPLAQYPFLVMKQRKELAELFGYESRNKYEIRDPSGGAILYAAEQGKGFGAALLRQIVGHWRRYEIHVFDAARNVVLRAVHPFRWFFQRLEVVSGDGRAIGAIQQRFAVFSKSFDVEDAQGRVIMSVRSPIWKPWTFPFEKGGRPVGTVMKKWSGALTELFTDADSFRIEYTAAELTPDERALLLAAGLFIDMQYFEQKAQASSSA